MSPRTWRGAPGRRVRGAIGTISRTSSIGTQRVRPARVNTSTRRISCGDAAGVVSIASTVLGEPFVIEAERGERILCLRNGFALSNHLERSFQIVGQW